MTTEERAKRIIDDYKGDKTRAYNHCIAYSVPRPDDELYALFGIDAEKDREEYKALAAYIKTLM